MADVPHISNSESSEDELVRTPERKNATRELSQPHSALSHRFRESPQMSRDDHSQGRESAEDGFAVMVPAPARPWEYQPWRGDTTVETVLEEVEELDGEQMYKIEFEDGRKENVSLDKLLTLRNGPNALAFYNTGDSQVKSSPSVMDSQDDSLGSVNANSRGKRIRKKAQSKDYVDITKEALDSDEEDELYADQGAAKKRRHEKGRITLLTKNGTRQSSRVVSTGSSRPQSRAIDEEGSDSDIHAAKEDENDELAKDVRDGSDDSDIQYVQRGNKKQAKNGRNRSQSQGKEKPGKGRPRRIVSESESFSEDDQPTRRSGRDRIIKSMRERDMDEEIYADEVAKINAPKVISIREIYQPVPKQSPFASFHKDTCDVCKGSGNNSNKGTSPLIYCQGCSTSIHKVCLGYRSAREHLVTKVGHENFVLQCRKCIGVPGKKDPSAPPLDICQGCMKPGPACKSFSAKKTAKQEEKLREENDGDDPVTKVAEELINNPHNVLFRCTRCQRAYHFEHLPCRKKSSKTPDDTEEIRVARLKEYTPKWQCKDCCDTPGKPQGLIAWRPTDPKSYKPEDTIEDFREDQKEYLIKWEDKSYFQCNWMPGSWVWGVTAKTMRNAFARRDEGANEKPKWTEKEAIPEENLTMEIVLDVEYDSEFEPESEEVDKAQISMIDQVLVKFEGLTYDDVVWEAPPKPDETDRWSAFVAAYNEYLAGKYFTQPSALVLKQRADEFRLLNYKKKIGLQTKQPPELTFPMFKYQIEGFNWLLEKFHQKKNVVLADEMGLGKTVQLIALMAYLVKDRPQCWPFLVVTPNSTCPNWRRELKKWAPGLRVVAYYGAKKAREMAYEYELYPGNSSDMRAHVVITSYEAPVDDHSRSFFRKIKWAGLIVDEGQRLKNDENLLYGALKALKAPFQVLLTGTPLQNNKRELFNLLQFLDSTLNASKLDDEYEELTKENIPELQDLIKPFFLSFETFANTCAVILPVTMSLVQKKLYKSILAKNPQLIKSIFGQSTAVLRPTERGNLNNILMQLRKCLCHPFLYSSAIEETSVSEEAMHRNLIDASAKFQLLELMLPKLRERGHRVLMFSQFLDQLNLIEDFLKGLDLSFRRIDGTVSAQEKQKRIDEYNAKDSPIFACLLSTRAGGVGINLATADTVIIMDPDFNPQQDIQAISRAHRIGQQKKVLVFQLMTKDTAEEKIIQIGRKKLALGALIETIGAEDDAGVDMESILKHGTEALFNDDDRNDIHYDSASVDKLLDRTQVENTNMDDDKTAESQFSLARVWAYDKGTLTDDVGDPDAEQAAPDISVWEQILKQREADAAAEAKRNMHEFGRGKRARQNVNYQKSNMDVDDDAVPSPHPKAKRRSSESASDLDFAEADNTDGDEESDPGDGVDPRELESGQDRSKGTRKKVQKRPTPQKSVSVAKSATPAKQVTKVKYKTPNATTVKSKPQAPQAKKQHSVGKPPLSSVKASAAIKGSLKPYVASKPLNGSTKNLAGIDKAQYPDEKSSIKRSTISKTPVATQGIPNQKNSAKKLTAGPNAKIVKTQVSTAYRVTASNTQTNPSSHSRELVHGHGHPHPQQQHSRPYPYPSQPQPNTGKGVPGAAILPPKKYSEPKPSKQYPSGPHGASIHQGHPNQAPVLPVQFGDPVSKLRFQYAQPQQQGRPTQPNQPQINNGGPIARPAFHMDGSQNRPIPPPSYPASQIIPSNGSFPQQVGGYSTNQETQGHRGPERIMRPGETHQRKPSTYQQSNPQPTLKPIEGTDCSLCGMAHIGIIVNCPQITTESEIRVLLDGLKDLAHTDQAPKVDIARRFLRGELAKLVQRKKARKLAQ
ncbi:Chromatin remodeling factor [Lachnellula occidentalis]|uniref:Chromatin remodeling factor n=1 Tax=Lachnellula occidentalis TaxID=215460 RepID=A0A8H8UIG6_9HELO|nr:Chromatin remodeling factor [Lachnellula occidentalis]